MPVKNYKPTSPGRRGMSVSDFADITRGEPEKSLLGGRVNKSGGRNINGRITSWHRGGGHRRRHRKIDFRRDKERRIVLPEYRIGDIFSPRVSVREALASVVARLGIRTRSARSGEVDASTARRRQWRTGLLSSDAERLAA